MNTNHSIFEVFIKLSTTVTGSVYFKHYKRCGSILKRIIVLLWIFFLAVCAKNRTCAGCPRGTNDGWIWSRNLICHTSKLLLFLSAGDFIIHTAVEKLSFSSWRKNSLHFIALFNALSVISFILVFVTRDSEFKLNNFIIH